jgi:hypothetical protein
MELKESANSERVKQSFLSLFFVSFNFQFFYLQTLYLLAINDHQLFTFISNWYLSFFICRIDYTDLLNMITYFLAQPKI